MIRSEAKLLRIFVGEADKFGHRALYEEIVLAARKAGLAGATVWRGIMSFGPTSVIHTARLLDLSGDLPIVIEIVDEEEKIDAFLPRLDELFEHSGGGGLVTIEKATVLRYRSGRKRK